MILILDNYDSFTYNLVHSIDENEEITVIRNDEMTPEEAERLSPDALIISPGPGRPSAAGYSEEYVRYFKDKIPILGICLGHQAICEAFGGEIDHAKAIVHGKKDKIILEENEIFKDLKNPIEAGRYHSLSAVRKSLPDKLEIIAETDDGEIMAVKHEDYPIWGLQFHPESIMTETGKQILKNFLEVRGDTGSDQ